MTKGKCNYCDNECEKTPQWGWRCKDCIRQYHRDWGKRRRALGFKTGGTVPKEWRDKYRKEYYSLPENKKRQSELAKKYRNDPQLRMKHEARWQVARAIKKGILKRQMCNCGNLKTEAHHPDYYKPLEVIWLCINCHRKEHLKQKAEGEA